MKNRLFLLFLLMMSVVACGEKDKPDYSLKDDYKDSKTISFTATIKSRAGDVAQSFRDNDAISVYGAIYDGGVAEPFDPAKLYISNAKYTLSEGLFTHGFEQYFLGEKMNFCAYAPYMSDFNSTMSEFTIPADQSIGYDGYDLMYAQKEDAAITELPAPVEFTPLFAKIRINLVKGESISTLNGLSVKVKSAANVVSIFRGEVTPLKNTGDLTPYKVNDNQYELLVSPQSIASGVTLLEFSFGQEVSTWKTNTPLNFTASTLIKIDVTVESSYLNVNISGNIDGWEDDDDPITGSIN